MNEAPRTSAGGALNSNESTEVNEKNIKVQGQIDPSATSPIIDHNQ
jgi:hypothetical protein